MSSISILVITLIAIVVSNGLTLGLSPSPSRVTQIQSPSKSSSQTSTRILQDNTFELRKIRRRDYSSIATLLTSTFYPNLPSHLRPPIILRELNRLKTALQTVAPHRVC